MNRSIYFCLYSVLIYDLTGLTVNKVPIPVYSCFFFVSDTCCQQDLIDQGQSGRMH